MSKRRERAIALGFFDGLHRGHAVLLNAVKARAEEYGCTPAVLTFDTPPASLVQGAAVPMITSAGDRVDMIRRLFGIDDVIIFHFDVEMMNMPWQEFAEILLRELSAAYVIVGADFRFGRAGEGTAEKLRDECAKVGVGCDIIPEITEEGEKISSSSIRALIAAGEIEQANALLGHPHTLMDTVRYGYKLGRTIGAPTINMTFPEGVLIPPFGVYATKVFIQGKEHPAVTNVGIRPTIGRDDQVTVESYILDYRGDLYGIQVRVEFHKFLREEIMFSDIEELKKQIQADAAAARAYFSQESNV